MAEPAGSDGVGGRFFSFPTAGDASEDMNMLQSLLSDFDPGAQSEPPHLAAASSPPQPPPGPSPAQPPLQQLAMQQQLAIRRWQPQPAQPAGRQEVVAESSVGQPGALQEAVGHAARREGGSSSGGTQPDARALSHKERSRAAQKKFRERQRQKAAQTSARMEQLEQQLAQLLSEKQGLEAEKRLLQHTAMVHATHCSELESQQQAFEIQQEVLLMDTARIYRRGLARPDLTLQHTKQFTMAAFLSVFEHFLGCYRQLLAAGGGQAGSAAHCELQELVCARRLEEAKIALFSRWASGQLAWNREETAAGLLQPPSPQHYQQVLASLELTPAQQQEWLAARRRLLARMADIRQRRQGAALALGLLLMRQPDPGGDSAEERQMRDSLEEEREAVLAFLYTVIDCHLTPVQEALLDVSCHPWWPCLWTLCGLLAARHKREPPDSLAEPEGAAGVLSKFSAAELLRQPLLARMGGLQLKRTVVTVPTPRNLLAAARQPEPRIADMQDLTVFEVMMGKHLERAAARPTGSA